MNEDPSKLKLSTDPSVESIDAEIADLARSVAPSTAVPSVPTGPQTSARPLLPVASAPVIAMVSALLCLALTMFNLGFYAGEEAPPMLSAADARADLDASLEVDAALLQSHLEFYGSYPANPEDAGLDPEKAFYLRVSPQRFTLTLEDNGYAVSVDSKDLQATETEAQEDEDLQ